MPKKLKVKCPHCNIVSRKWKKEVDFMMTCRHCEKTFATEYSSTGKSLKTFKSAAQTTPSKNFTVYKPQGEWMGDVLDFKPATFT